MRRVMLFLGSFNPVHNAHMALGEYVLARELCDEVWFVVSPQNPMKKSCLADVEQRLQMVGLAVAESKYADRMAVSDVECHLPRPSYTINTVDLLQQKYPDYRFSILCGGDLAASIERWKESERLLRTVDFYLYPRNGCVGDGRFVCLSDAPQSTLSSTMIRERVAKGESIDGMTAKKVVEYITLNKLYL